MSKLVKFKIEQESEGCWKITRIIDGFIYAPRYKSREAATNALVFLNKIPGKREFIKKLKSAKLNAEGVVEDKDE